MNYKNASNDIEVDNDIIRRIATFALYTTAIEVMKENPATNGHALRVEYAKRVLDGDVAIIPVMYALFTDATLRALARAGQATDLQVQDAMDSIFGYLAGVST